MKKGYYDTPFQRASILQLTLSVGLSVMQSFDIKGRNFFLSFILFILPFYDHRTFAG